MPLACDSVRHRLRRQRIFGAIDEAGWKIVALLRLGRAVPFTLQKYLFDSLRFPFWYYVMATLSGIIRHAGQCRPGCCASAGRREGYGGSLALVPPLTETTARPRALRPQHRTHLAVRTGAEIS